MSGVIDEDGQQWEHCNSCTKFVKIEELEYEKPSEKFQYGRDLCKICWFKITFDGIEPGPDPEEVAARQCVAERHERQMEGIKYEFGPTVHHGPGIESTQMHLVWEATGERVTEEEWNKRKEMQ